MTNSLACRFFLGLAEGGLIPGIVMWVSTWYKRSEMQLRLAWIFSFISLAGAFAGCEHFYLRRLFPHLMQCPLHSTGRVSR